MVVSKQVGVDLSRCFIDLFLGKNKLDEVSAFNPAMLVLIQGSGDLLGGEVVLQQEAPAGGHKIAAARGDAAQTVGSVTVSDDPEAIDLLDVAVLVGGENVLGHEGLEDGFEWGATAEAVIDDAGVAEGIVGNGHGRSIADGLRFVNSFS